MATKVLHTIDPKDQAEVRRVQDLCHKLHLMPPPVAYVGARVYQCPPELLDENGNIPIDLRLDKLGVEPVLVYDARSQSWVRNAYNIVVTQMCGVAGSTGGGYGAGNMPIRNIAGTQISSGTSSFRIHGSDLNFWIGGVGNSNLGIVVGTGTVAESLEDHKLGTPVANGTGAGQMSYTAQETTVSTYTGGTRIWDSVMMRYINNNSGGAIVIGEAGAYVTVSYAASSTTCMLCRDLLAATVNVPDTAQLKVTYTIDSMAYPA